MPVVALVSIVVWIVAVAVFRGAQHVRSTGASPIRATDPIGSPAWWARIIGAIGLLLLVLGPVADLLGMARIPVLDHPSIAVAGLVLVIGGIVATVVAQSAMGASWRGDVDPDVRTPLVTSGPFRWVRNPILTATAVTTLGIVLMAPNLVAVASLAAVLTSQQIQVRLVEEPYLERVHGADYVAYAARTGRFLPWIGRRTPRT